MTTVSMGSPGTSYGPPAIVTTKRISWSAILAGVFIAVAIQLLLSLLGAGLGLSSIDPVDRSSPEAATLGMGALVWWAASSAIALFAAGAVAAHLSGSVRKSDAALQGLLTWAVAAILTAYLLTSVVGAVLRGVGGVASTAASVTASGAAAVAAPAAGAVKEELQERGITLGTIRAQAEALLRQTGKPELRPEAIAGRAGQAADQAASAAATPRAGSDDTGFDDALRRLLEAGKDTARQVDRDAVVNVIVQRTGASRQEAEQRVDGWITSYREAQAKFAEQKERAAQQAREAADAAARATSAASLGAVLVLLVGAVAAALGGLVGRQRGTVAVVAR